jgi:hypothetical protein
MRLFVAIAVVAGLLATWAAYVAGVWSADLVGWAVGAFTYLSLRFHKESACP